MSGSSTYMATLIAGDTELHQWCDRCLTSAGIKVSLLMLTENGVSEVGTHRACRRCDDD